MEGAQSMGPQPPMPPLIQPSPMCQGLLWRPAQGSTALGGSAQRPRCQPRFLCGFIIHPPPARPPGAVPAQRIGRQLQLQPAPRAARQARPGPAHPHPARAVSLSPLPLRPSPRQEASPPGPQARLGRGLGSPQLHAPLLQSRHLQGFLGTCPHSQQGLRAGCQRHAPRSTSAPPAPSHTARTMPPDPAPPAHMAPPAQSRCRGHSLWAQPAPPPHPCSFPFCTAQPCSCTRAHPPPAVQLCPGVGEGGSPAPPPPTHTGRLRQARIQALIPPQARARGRCFTW